MNLTPEQALKLREQVGERLEWLTRLQSRMEKLGVSHADPLYVATVRARNVMQDLFMAAHYASCESGVGKTE